MRYLQKFENYSSQYYMKFNKNDVPKVVKFDDPNMTFELLEIVPGSNQLFIKYGMTSEQPDVDNPYSGDMPNQISIDIGITYNNDSTKIYTTIVGGNRSWWSFSYESGVIEDIETSNIKLSDESTNALIDVLDKYTE